MRQWRWWQVIAACATYGLAVLAVTTWWLTAQAEAAMRRAGMPADDLYVLLPRPRAWWVALLVLPPAALVAARARRPR